MGKRRVVVTGLGAVHPFGVGVPLLWQKVVAGENGVKIIRHFDTSDYYCKVGAYVENFNPLDYLDRKVVMATDTFQQYGLVATLEALKDSGLPVHSTDSFRIGIVAGSNNGGVSTILEEAERYRRRGIYRVAPLFIPRVEIDMLPGHIAILTGIRGPNIGVTASCATGNIVIGWAFRLIQAGDIDVALAVGAEAAISPIALSAFTQLRALAKMWPKDPTRSLRPFDKERTGTIFGDGASCLILESLESAEKRNARIYAEVAGLGMSDDAYHFTAPDPEGTGAAYSMSAALRDAGLRPEELEHIHAHGTGTPYNDVTETRAIKKVFGQYAYHIPISATKAVHGHMLGAAGTTESLITCLTLYHGIIPPTMNHENPDDECDLDYVPQKARKQTVHTALVNAFGFGGHNASLVFKAHPG